MPAIASIGIFENFTQDLATKVHDLNADVLKLALTNTDPALATAAGLADITQIAAGNGYLAGGFTLVNAAITRTGDVTKLDADDLPMPASGGAIGPFQWAVIYNDTSTGDRTIAKIAWDSAVTIADGTTPTLRFNAAGIVLIDGSPA